MGKRKRGLKRPECSVRGIPHGQLALAAGFRLGRVCHFCGGQRIPNAGLKQRRHAASWKTETSNIEHPTSNIQPRTSNLEHPTSNIQPRTSNLEHPTSNIQHRTCNPEHPTSNIQPRTSNIEP